MDATATTGVKRPITRMMQRFLLPAPVISCYYLWKYGALISPRAEVECTSNIILGPKCSISSFSKFKATDGVLRVGRRAGFATGCFISASSGGIEIGDNFICGPNVVMVASNYITDEMGVHLEDQGNISRGIRIGHNVWIGGNSTVLDGTVIGDDTIVFAGSLLNRRYPPRTVLQGNPAKIVLRRG